MGQFLTNLNPVLATLIATLFTFTLTSLGSAVVLFCKKVNKNVLDTFLALASGVMIAASFWSLLSPAIDMAEELNLITWLVASIGFLFGGLFLYLSDRLFNKFLSKKDIINEKSKYKRIMMLIFSITLHNIPEGMAIGVAFGSFAYGLTEGSILSCFALAIGIGLQNFPEGSAVSLPLRGEGLSRKKSFILGSLSGIVEPIAGLLGVILVLKLRTILPFLLSFAAGAMIYVVVCELIPESTKNKYKEIMTLFTLFGFSIMMVLDVALG